MSGLSKITIIKILALVGIIIYSIKIPSTKNVALFPVVFAILCLYTKGQIVRSSIIKKSNVCWAIIIIWGVILSFVNGIVLTNFKILMWCLSFVTLPMMISYYSQDYRIYKFFRIAVILACLPIGLLGIYEGISGHYVHETIASYAYTKSALGFYRPNTIFYNVNDNAIFCLICSILAFYVEGTPRFKRITRFVCLLVFGLNIIMVDSRGAELGLVLFLVIYFYRSVKGLKRFLLIATIIPVFFIGVNSFDYQTFFDIEGRVVIWSMSLDSLADTSYFGVGPGMISSINEARFINAEVVAVHNFLLEMFCDFGIVGLCVIVYWYYCLFYYAIKSKTVSYEKSALLIGSLVASILASITCSSLLGKSFPVLFFAIVIAELNIIYSKYIPKV